MRLVQFFWAAILGLSAVAVTLAHATVPGVVIGHSHPETGIYLGSPSILILDDGTYLASFQEFGSVCGKDNSCLTFVSQSADRGETWTQISEITGLYWANLFAFKGAIYLMGTQMQVSQGYGPLVLHKSTDAGHTWSAPTGYESGLLRDDHQYHTAPMPMLIHRGRIFRAIEDRYPPEKWGVNFRSLVISAPVDADLMNAASWTTSNRLRYDQNWTGRAWLEGNILVNPQREIVNILRNDYRPEGGRACRVRVSKYGETVRFDPDIDFISFPGGSKMFVIRYDAVSGRYWSLSNYIPERYNGGNPERTRNTLALVSSVDLLQWDVHKIVLQHEDVENVGFQYASWRFDGGDIAALIRTAYPESDGTDAHNAHDSNYIIFYRITDFRKHQQELWR